MVNSYKPDKIKKDKAIEQYKQKFSKIYNEELLWASLALKIAVDRQGLELFNKVIREQQNEHR